MSANHLDHANEYLAFTLGGQEYGVDILKVQEIRGYEVATRLPEAPDYIKGVINLRGVVVPVVDLRIKFRLAEVEYNELTVMIIVRLHDQTIGIVVDGVSDVVALAPDQIRRTPQFDRTFDARLLTGIGMVGDRLLVLLDMEKVALGSEIEHAMEAIEHQS